MSYKSSTLGIINNGAYQILFIVSRFKY